MFPFTLRCFRALVTLSYLAWNLLLLKAFLQWSFIAVGKPSSSRSSSWPYYVWLKLQHETPFLDRCNGGIKCCQCRCDNTFKTWVFQLLLFSQEVAVRYLGKAQVCWRKPGPCKVAFSMPQHLTGPFVSCQCRYGLVSEHKPRLCESSFMQSKLNFQTSLKICSICKINKWRFIVHSLGRNVCFWCMTDLLLSCSFLGGAYLNLPEWSQSR